jgi:hypothetical protein
MGARKIGVPDPAFYAATILTTLGLVLLYFEVPREKAKRCLEAFSRLRKSRPSRSIDNSQIEDYLDPVNK